MGPKKPTASVEIPAVVVSLQLDQAKGAGLGRFVYRFAPPESPFSTHALCRVSPKTVRPPV